MAFPTLSIVIRVTLTALIGVCRAFVRRWTAEQRDAGYTMFLGVDEVIYGKCLGAPIVTSYPSHRAAPL